jgi:small conductance mechanosensitive channel
MPEFVTNFLNGLASFALNTGLKIVIALILLLIAFRFVSWLSRKIEARSALDHHDKTLFKVLAYLVNIGLKVIVVICLVGYLGIDTSGLTALVASFGVCIGLAVNGALANLAGGVLIIVTRPFRIDDFIEAQGISGTVEDIHITCTKLRTPDNKIIFVPNGALSSGNIVNYSMMDTRRVDFTFSIAYDSDFDKARALILAIFDAHDLILKDPAPMARMCKHGSSAIDIVARVWVKSDDYWTVNFDILEAVKETFDRNGICIPFDQLDVHVKKD